MEGAMRTLLPKLVDLLVGEYKLQKGVKREIKKLEEELTSMTAVLRKVSEVPEDQLDELTKIWTSDVRELSYDIEDAIDTFMHMLNGKAAGHGPPKPFSFKGLIDRATSLFSKVKSNHKIHGVIKDIMEQVKTASERRGRYQVDEIAARPKVVTVDPRLEAMYRKTTELVGIHGPKNELAKRLSEPDCCSSRQQPDITSIVGFGGLGKTTLANSLLLDLKAQFDCHFFVSVSSNPDVMMLFKNILVQLDKKKYAHISQTWEMKQLIDDIREFLENRRFLCVIDDLWKGSAWDTIKLALQDGNSGGKIIITTRNKAVAEHAGGVIYQLKPLSDDDSRELFSKRIFGYQDDAPADLREVTGKILKKCGGVPLAIITIASLVASKPMHSQEWEKVYESITSGLGDSLDVDKMRKILSLSYNDLPFNLKNCLLSLTKYPEDHVISRDVLVCGWIAEGFIAADTRPAWMTSLLQIGESYFNELINRSLIQQVNGPYCEEDGEVHACQVHDMVLELINRLAAEDGYVTTPVSDPRTSAPQKRKIRRLSLRKSNASYARSPTAREDLSSVRSLTAFSVDILMPPLSSFRVIRVLQLEDCTGLNEKYLNGIGELHHLRFLRLWKYSARELPEAIGNLESLETLDIRGRSLLTDVILLPKSFIKLQKLVRLFIGRVELAQGLTLGDFKCLQDLAVCSTPEVVKEVGNLKELRTLRIVFDYRGSLDFMGAIPLCLHKCTKLHYLKMSVNAGTSEAVEMQQVPSGLRRFVCNLNIVAFPKWMNSSMLSCLSTLSIRVVAYDKALLPQHLEKLAALPSLRFLKLFLIISRSHTRSYQKLPIHSGAWSFRCLREFHFYSSSVLPTFQPGAMPQLERLCLQFFREVSRNNFKDFGWENLRSLRQVSIYYYDEERMEARATVRKALMDHPNHPSVELF